MGALSSETGNEKYDAGVLYQRAHSNRLLTVKLRLLFLLSWLSATFLSAQQPNADSLATPSGAWARLEVQNGDSTFVMALRLFNVAARREFKDFAEQRQYYLYMRAARKVYPYALQAINLYEEIRAETEEMNNRQRRRYIRKENKELKDDFKEQMKNLSRTEGKVLLKMIEKEVEKPFYDVIRETRGGMTAGYWHNLGKIWGYDLKKGYQQGEDKLLDEIFLDYDFGQPEWWN